MADPSFRGAPGICYSCSSSSVCVHRDNGDSSRYTGLCVRSIEPENCSATAPFLQPSGVPPAYGLHESFFADGHSINLNFETAIASSHDLTPSLDYTGSPHLPEVLPRAREPRTRLRQRRKFRPVNLNFETGLVNSVRAPSDLHHTAQTNHLHVSDIKELLSTEFTYSHGRRRLPLDLVGEHIVEDIDDTSISTSRQDICKQPRVRRRKTSPQLHVGESSVTVSSSQQGVASDYIDLGDCINTCEHCNALFWYEERLKGTANNANNDRFKYHKCCGGGKVLFSQQNNTPECIKELFQDGHFMQNIRAYNQMFSMTSFGAKVDDSINNFRGPYVFKISGQIYHWIGSMCPTDGDPPRFLQLYIFDTENEVSNRLRFFGGENNQSLNPAVVERLVAFLDAHNDLVKLFRTAREICGTEQIPDFKIRLYNVAGQRGYELPAFGTLGAIVFEDGPLTTTDYDVIIQFKGGHPQRVNKLHPSYMSLQYPLLFLFGQPGFHTKLKLNEAASSKVKRMSMNMFYTYQLHPRLNSDDLLFRGGRLFQQYVVGVYCCIEQNRMDYIRANQNDIRNDHLSGIYDAISRGDRDGSAVGSRVILPSSFTGGPRYMYSHYLDALAICRVLGNPQFFITFTCNVNWPEIRRYMANFTNLSASDRADVVCRVFEQKVHLLERFLKERKPFGDVKGVLYTIEFQKRGLPHCHMLLWVYAENSMQNGGRIDQYISAELPDPIIDARGYNTVSELMMHGPCGYSYSSAPCMNKGVCSKKFPKKYNNETFFDKDGHTHYKRRETGICTKKHGVELDNSYVVPYNRTLLLSFQAHINVEYCGWSMLIKYLFKYISKGTDRVAAQITRDLGDAPISNNQSELRIDEIQNYLDCRYICPHEACWRILNFDIHSREPAVQILAVHVENMQQLHFRAKEHLDTVVNLPDRKKTTLTEWFDANASSTQGHHLTYLDFPKEFVWYGNGKYWAPRKLKSKFSIGRLAYIHPSLGELYYLRMLLCHQKGCTSFAGLRTINQQTFTTYRLACHALGILGDDREWNTALEEASISSTAFQLRNLFAHILIYCDVSDPGKLWATHWANMCDDIPIIMSKSLQIHTLHINHPEIEHYVLFEVEAILNSQGKRLTDFGLPAPPQRLLDELKNRLLMEERNYNREMLLEENKINVPKLNIDQRRVYDLILDADNTGKQQLIFVYGHGGTGKTFLWRTITGTFRAQCKIVLVVASSGIASLLLPSGRTAHSRFKLPLELTDESLCKVKKHTHIGDLLTNTDLIIWDEAPMNDRRCFETLDRTLRDLLDRPNTLFGGKSILLGGDFRQTLPVKKGAPKSEIVATSIAESYLWSNFQLCILKENMRLSKLMVDNEDKNLTTLFASWLIDVGDGKLGVPDADDPENTSWLEIPSMYCIKDIDNGMTELIDFIYDEATLRSPSAEILQQKAIVCPKNDTATIINQKILSMLSGHSTIYASSDEATAIGNDRGETEMLYPTEYLNEMNFSGLPPHLLELKIGTPVMLLRNINLGGGLCNGTRMIVKQLLSKVIEVQIITGTRVGEKVFIHRICLTHKEPKFPFIFKRKQFPIKLCYAMTINKSQGQSLNNIGVYLPEPIFGHGQLYVALSRATTAHGLKICIQQQENQQPNTTKNIVYKDFLSKIQPTRV